MKSILFLLGALVACGPRTASDSAGKPNPQIESFDYAWQRVRDTYHNPDMDGLDWDAIRDELRPKAEKAIDNDSLRLVLLELLSRLDASHFQVVPSSLYEAGYTNPTRSAASPSTPPPSGTVGLEMRWVEDALRVTQVHPTGPAAQAGITRGYQVTTIDGFDPRGLVEKASSESAIPHLLARAANNVLSGDPGTELTLVVKDIQDQPETLTLTRTQSPGDVVRLGYLPPITVIFEHKVLQVDAAPPLGLIRFNAFMQPAGRRFTESMVELLSQDIEGMVIDLRGNPGGVVAMTMGMAGHFIPDTGISLGTMTQRHMTLHLNVIPRIANQQFHGPIAILVDELSASTSEVFALAMQALGRARVFGNTSAGMALPSIFEALPNGDGLQFAIGDLHGPHGNRLEGRGVTPDTPIQPTASALKAGKDPALDTAIAWLLTEIQVSQ